MRFTSGDNITAVVEGFLNYFELGTTTSTSEGGEGVKQALLKRARHG